MGNLFSFGEKEKTFAVIIMLAAFVPKDGQRAAVIMDSVEAKPIPEIVWQKWLDFELVIGARAEADETGDKQISESGMVVVATALFLSFEPLARGFVKVLTDVRLAIVMLGMNVSEESIEIVAGCDKFLRIIVEHVGQCDESLRSGERPNRAVPFAFAAAVRTEFGMAAFGGRDPERRAKALRIV